MSSRENVLVQTGPEHQPSKKERVNIGGPEPKKLKVGSELPKSSRCR